MSIHLAGAEAPARAAPRTTEPMGPLRFQPILKHLIWGGRRLGTMLGKSIGPGDDYAESWELADHRHGQSLVADGPMGGTPLAQLVARCGPELLGRAVPPRGQFPLLVKFIDARQVLSVQVHPDDRAARRLVDDNGKTEAWVVLHAEPGGLIYAGLKPGVSRGRFVEAMDSGRVEQALHSFEARAGDCIHIPAGTVHAIGAGVLLAEVQQMSDATFRVWDWGRVGADGRPRPLHRDEAIEVIDFDAGPVSPVVPRPEAIDGGSRESLVRCPYFALDRFRLRGPATVGDPDGDRFTVLIGLGGAVDLHHQAGVDRLEFGRTLLLPAALGPCEAVPVGPSGRAVVLSCTAP